jgi:high-affinity Fe2+/Pb2+ permease
VSTLVSEWIAPAFAIIGAVVGAVVGAGISYIVQTKTQRNAWKREYSVKIAETVYAALYSEVKGILSLLERGIFYTVSFGKWREEEHVLIVYVAGLIVFFR